MYNTQLLATNIFKNLGGIAIAVLILLIMVTLHELGHYLAGKALGFKINEFSVGFGPALFKKRSKKTGELFAVRIVPLGGYCAFDGEDETNNTDETGTNTAEDEPFAELNVKQEKTEEPPTTESKPSGKKFNEQAPWKRIIVLVAGATMNYLFALLLIVVMFFAYGNIHSYVSYKGEDTPTATEETLAPKDIVLTIDGDGVYLPTDYTSALSGKKQGEEIAIEIMRRVDGTWQKKTLNVTLLCDVEPQNMADMSSVYNALGLDGTQYSFGNVTTKGITDEGFFETIGRSFAYSWKMGGIVLRSLGELLTGKLPITSMGGPTATIGATAQAASGGLLSVLNISALIGVNLAVFNLLPIPALDGSKVVFCIIEWIRKKPLNRKVETLIHFIGILFLFGFAILVDILHWAL